MYAKFINIFNRFLYFLYFNFEEVDMIRWIIFVFSTGIIERFKCTFS